MNIEGKIKNLFQVIIDETKNNNDFAEKISCVFTESKPVQVHKNKRKPALFHPIIILDEKGEEALLHSLNKLDIDQLKDIVAEYGMDPAKKVMRWKKKEKFVAHIIEVSHNRLKKGNAFRE
ncbi:hypothetical protein SAMN05880501_106114 [Ureibacillus xyleni]|uniref:Uncharacterized protein n=1 Tax=Ureibacillus xyleni TaxID=614648 RepID=A0A285ST97_9BACL|nr:hypothetical protein [Ureibacillus xyleni]SOC11265.1 hypothetical protein SAMN05880501_106114 [Ureibacillus xyleni]